MKENIVKLEGSIIPAEDDSGMTSVEKHIASLPEYQQPHMLKYAIMARKLRAYRESLKDRKE